MIPRSERYLTYPKERHFSSQWCRFVHLPRVVEYLWLCSDSPWTTLWTKKAAASASLSPLLQYYNPQFKETSPCFRSQLKHAPKNSYCWHAGSEKFRLVVKRGKKYHSERKTYMQLSRNFHCTVLIENDQSLMKCFCARMEITNLFELLLRVNYIISVHTFL